MDGQTDGWMDVLTGVNCNVVCHIRGKVLSPATVAFSLVCMIKLVKFYFNVGVRFIPQIQRLQCSQKTPQVEMDGQIEFILEF